MRFHPFEERELLAGIWRLLLLPEEAPPFLTHENRFSSLTLNLRQPTSLWLQVRLERVRVLLQQARPEQVLAPQLWVLA